jgi:hypothetical protein
MRVQDGDVDGGGEVTAPPQHLVFAYYITGHGFGHATRALEVRRRSLRPLAACLPGAGAYRFLTPSSPGGEAPGRRGARRARGHRRARVRLHHRDRLPQPPHPQGPARLRRRPGRRPHSGPPRLAREGLFFVFLFLALLCKAQLDRPPSFLEFLIIMVRGVQYHQTAVVPRESILKTEAEWLNSIKADLVVPIL